MNFDIFLWFAVACVAVVSNAVREQSHSIDVQKLSRRVSSLEDWKNGNRPDDEETCVCLKNGVRVYIPKGVEFMMKSQDEADGDNGKGGEPEK